MGYDVWPPPSSYPRYSPASAMRHPPATAVAPTPAAAVAPAPAVRACCRPLVGSSVRQRLLSEALSKLTTSLSVVYFCTYIAMHIRCNPVRCAECEYRV